MDKIIKLLLVEDDKNLGYILRSYLNAKGYPTVLSADGMEALNRFENEAFDFVILDTVLPGLDGYFHNWNNSYRIGSGEWRIYFCSNGNDYC